MINSNSNKSQKMNQRVESLDKAIDVIRAVEIYTTELKNIDIKELNHFMCNHDRVGTNGLLKDRVMHNWRRRS